MYVPAINPVMVVALDPGVVMVGVFGPLTLDHAPVPVVGTFPPIVTIVELQTI